MFNNKRRNYSKAVKNFLIEIGYRANFQRTLGCSEQDHRSCDDVCKGDSYWYGFCSAWDGRDLKCSCSGYRYPLDGNVCGPSRQQKCVEECRGKGQESGGYCVVSPSSENRRGVPKCSCFGKPR
uniref:WSC domain-containing protein n=1 Tax=Meloidogyne floridensis TaxID=298350 RepID=A0A915NBB3_9BILA